ncbi:hypothetical protein BO83DRAFT_412029 [Aspergillus eucalypticola CBS 122712]|uniref:Uncharacterized protein n=1 Tax=Aspergillus eucalypticola (strain CBS 122712 / IBT 29274) TaxID=1448314 RepID=A0A317UQN5_ASPEC|nr:uncharacterized protein BO83DRAFT_412029 [Aspergillus eucalypticola CBS 122712]PWY63388.1 hypothetical protein BO83DRAFT_412029 [Aspergillus eucalypticola CBS 122712]
MVQAEAKHPANPSKLHRARGTGLGPMLLSRDRTLSPNKKSSSLSSMSPSESWSPSHRIPPAASHLHSLSLLKEASQTAVKSHRRHPSPVTIHHHHSFHPALEAASPPRPASTRSG